MILKYALSPEEYLEAQSAFRTRLARGRVFFRNLYGLAAIAVVLGAYVRFSGHRWLGYVLFLSALLLFLERVILWRWRAAKLFRESDDLREPIELNVDESSLQRTSSSGTEEIRWANILASHETRNLFVLQLSRHEFLTIPKRALSPGDHFRLKEMLQKELIVKTTRENQDALLLKFVVTWGIGAIVLMTLFAGFFYNVFNRPARYPRRVTPQGSASTPAQPRPAAVTALRGKGPVYLVPLGDVKSVTVPSLIDEFQKRYNLKINLLPEIPLPAWALNPVRKQYAAEDLVAAMKVAYPKIAADPTAVLVGLTDTGMYISASEWRYAFSDREEERYAVVSTANLSLDDDDDRVTPAALQVRVRKFLTKDVGILHYRFQPSSDYRSVLYDSIDESSDVDEMGEDYLESDVEVRADLHVKNGDPCFILRHYTLPERAHADGGTVSDCSGYYKELNLETVQIDLRYGLLLDQRTDFLIKDRIPLELTRVLRTQDPRARAFGVGGNHNLNIFLVGDKWPFTWIDVILEHGGRSHFKRSNWGIGYWDARYTNWDAPRTEFRGSTIEWGWSGWKLSKPSGTVYRFPDSGNATRPEQGSLVAIEKSNGDRLNLSRNAAGELLHAWSPGGNDLEFRYDASSRIISAQDQGGDRFEYSYDGAGHLAKVIDAAHRITEYSYDSAGHMTSVSQDGAKICTLEYDSQDRVRLETLAGGRTYRFQYSLGRRDEVTSVDIIDSAGPVRRLRISSGDYSLDYPAR